VSGESTELILILLFSGVLVGEFFLLEPDLPIIVFSSSKCSFFFGDSILIPVVLFSSTNFTGDTDGLFVFLGISVDCTVFLGDELGVEIDFGDDLGVVTIFFFLAGETVGVLKLSYLAGEFFGVI